MTRVETLHADAPRARQERSCFRDRLRGGIVALILLLVPALAWGQGAAGESIKLDSLNIQSATPSPSPIAPGPSIMGGAAVPGSDRIVGASSPPLDSGRDRPSAPPSPKPEPRTEFEEYVVRALGLELRLYGHDFFTEAPSTFAPLDRVPVPADYALGPGDEIVVQAWGQLDVDYRAAVDRNGRIFIPKVGSIGVAGVRYEHLERHLRGAIGRIYRNFEMSVSLGQLRSMQIFVTGQARRPGGYVVSSLSTLVSALFATGGPSRKGSLRAIQIRRGDKVAAEFDLYDLILKGDKSRDAKLLPGDVIFIPPAGPLVAVSGSVNTPAIYELRGGGTLDDLFTLAGGLSINASGRKVTLERVRERSARVVEEVALDAGGGKLALRSGDIVNVHTLSPKVENAVTLRGNVAETVRFAWRSGMRVSDVIPEREALIVPDYWVRRNSAGRPASWLRTPQAAQEDNARPRNDIVRNVAEITWEYAVIERLDAQSLQTHLVPFNLGKAIVERGGENDLALLAGDVITVFSKDDVRVPRVTRTPYVILEGEIAAAGVYEARPGETLRQLVARVGGLSAHGYLYGAEFTRESTRAAQQRQLDDAISRLEAEAERAASAQAQKAISPDAGKLLEAQVAAQRALIGRLRGVRAAGRIVLKLPRETASVQDLPDIPLENGDRFYVPPRPGTVSVFGAVYNPNAYLHDGVSRAKDYLALAGGPTRDAEEGSVYVVHADGSVVSERQTGWFGSIGREAINPGDAVVVPESFERFSLTRELRDWTQILYQFAIGVVGLVVLGKL